MVNTSIFEDTGKFYINDDKKYLSIKNADGQEKILETFIAAERLKDESFNLYAWVRIKNEKLYVKFGETGRNAYKRLKSTGCDHVDYVIRLWKSNIGDDPIHKKLKSRSNNNRGYKPAPIDVLNTEEAYEIESEIGLENLIKDITEYAEPKEVVSKNIRQDYDDVVELVDGIVYSHAQEVKTKYLLYLCTRYGKTGVFCRLFKELNIFGTRIHVLASYVGTVRASYAEEIRTLVNNENCLFADPDEYTSKDALIKDIQRWLQDENHYICYYVALTGDADTCFKRRIEPLTKFKNINKSLLIEEADFGAGCDKQIKKLKHLYEMKSNHFQLMAATTGTHAEKCTKIFEPEVIIKRDYIIDVLNKRKNAVGLSWFCLNNNEMVKVFGYSCFEMENFSDMFTVTNNKLRGEIWFRDVINYIFKKELPVFNRETRKYRDHDLLNEDAATMIFTASTKEGQKFFVELLEQLLPDYKIVLLNGDETTNAEAEALVKQVIKDCGTKVIIVASGMANRSFSIPEIKNIILLCNSGDPRQKVARGLTPWKDNPEIKCNVIDFRLNYESNLSNYLSSLAIDTFNDTATCKTVPQLIDVIQATGKLAFYEYFAAGTDPIKKLDNLDIKKQMYSREYQVVRAINLINRDLDRVDFPNAKFIVNEELKLDNLTSTNIKGDSDKKAYIGRTIKSATGKSKKELEEDPRINYLAYLLNKRMVFDSGKYETNVLENEFKNNMPDKRKAAIENCLGIDMNVMIQIAELLIKNEIAIYG